MHRSGRANWVAIAVVALGLAIAVYMIFSGESPSTGAAKFMTALAEADAERLADLSYYSPERDRAQVVEAWKKTLDIGEHYIFAWRINSEHKSTDTTAKVALSIMRNLDKPSSYDETFNVDVVKVGSQWKVDVAGLSREMYPGLPR